MKKIKRIIILAFLISITAGFLSTTQAAEDDNYCYLEASVDVFVAVWHLDDDGNRGYLIWEGVVKPGKPKLIRTFSGQMRIATTTDYKDNAPLEGDDDRWCNGGASIEVP
jgi:hypothetical protein